MESEKCQEETDIRKDVIIVAATGTINSTGYRIRRIAKSCPLSPRERVRVRAVCVFSSSGSPHPNLPPEGEGTKKRLCNPPGYRIVSAGQIFRIAQNSSGHVDGDGRRTLGVRAGIDCKPAQAAWKIEKIFSFFFNFRSRADDFLRCERISSPTRLVLAVRLPRGVDRDVFTCPSVVPLIEGRVPHATNRLFFLGRFSLWRRLLAGTIALDHTERRR